MNNLKFEKGMETSIKEFSEYLSANGRKKQLNDFNDRCALINTALNDYHLRANTVSFYKNPYLFNLKDLVANILILARVEGNKCLIEMYNNNNKEISKCMINFTTKRYLKL